MYYNDVWYDGSIHGEQIERGGSFMPEFAGRPGGRMQNNYFDGLPISEPQTILFGMLMLLYFFQRA